MKIKRRICSSGFLAVVLLVIALEAAFLEGCSCTNGRRSDSVTETSITESDSSSDAFVENSTTQADTTQADTTEATTTVEATTVAPTTQTTTQADTTTGTTAGSTQGTTSPTTSANTTTQATGDSTQGSELQTTPSSSGNLDKISFSITTFSVNYDSNRDYYSYMINDLGYNPVNSVSDLSTLCATRFNAPTSDRGVIYITTPKDIFDTAANDMKALKAQADATGSYSDIYARDAYMYNYLGLDYQTYFTKGLSLFLFQKVQDVVSKNGSYSVYAVCYYSYLTAEQMNIVDNTVSQIVSRFTGSDYDKILAAHDYLCSIATYSEDITAPLVHTAYGALINGNAVCEGYAKAYKLMLNAMGYECDIVINATHAWVVVNYNSSWYFIDITNNDVNDCHVFFMLGSDVLNYNGIVYVDNFSFDFTFYGYTTGNNTDHRTLATTSLGRKVEYR